MATTPAKDLKVGDAFTYEGNTYTVTYIHPSHRTGPNHAGLAAASTTTGKEKGFTFPANLPITTT